MSSSQDSKSELDASHSLNGAVANRVARGDSNGYKDGGTHNDMQDMRILGRTQQLNRNFKFLSTLGFACTLMSTWEIELSTVIFGLVDGGTAGLIWGYLFCWAGYCTVFASIAEMASMSPTSGGQYHWVSEFAPERHQRFLSWLVGWISVMGWQVGLASLTFIVGTMIQGLITLDNIDYNYERWHGTLLVIAIVAFCIIFNSFLAKKLPMVESMILILHILGFFGVLIPLWVLAPRKQASDVFGDLTNFGGWSTNGLAFMVGLYTPVYTLLGADSAVHMSEEIRDASITLPKAIMWSAAINGSLGWIMTITFCFTAGDVFALIDPPSITGYPFIQVFSNVTRSNAGASIMTAIVLVNITSACISTVATVSRQTWSFARDNGLPFSGFVAHVKPGWNIPLNSVLVTFTITCLLSLINIGSTVAFNAIGSLALVAILGTYIISISVLIARRFRGPLPDHRWSLGKFGLPINVLAVVWLLSVWVFCFFPYATPVTLTTMNWNAVMFVGISVVGLVYWFAWGRRHYTPPVYLVKRDV